MRWVRFLMEQDSPCWGRVEGSTIIVLSGSPFDRHGHHDTIERLPLTDTPLLPPCCPSKIVCIGRNYREHARELGNEPPAEPLLFLKPPSAVIAPGGEITLPRLSERVDHEGELALVIGRRCCGVQLDEDPRKYIHGYTCLNDVTARDLQKKDGQWARAKGFDTFCPLGPWIENAPNNSSRPWHNLRVETRVNGELRQQGNTSDFIFPVNVLLHAITAVMTLEPQDVIATGTPSGVGPLHAGDHVAITIEGIGTLENRVRAAAA